MKKIKV